MKILQALHTAKKQARTINDQWYVVYNASNPSLDWRGHYELRASYEVAGEQFGKSVKFLVARVRGGIAVLRLTEPE
jgi:hypothetical protein